MTFFRYSVHKNRKKVRENQARENLLRNEQNWNVCFMQRFVATINDAKKIKAAGWEKETTFYWYADEHSNGAFKLGRVLNELIMLPAPTADEVMQYLPSKHLLVKGTQSGYLVGIGGSYGFFESYRLVDALLKLWIAYKEGGEKI